MKDALYELFQRVPCETQDDSNLLTAAGELLDALRDKSAAYDEVMRRLSKTPKLCAADHHDDDALDLSFAVTNILADEQKAGRYVP